LFLQIIYSYTYLRKGLKKVLRKGAEFLDSLVKKLSLPAMLAKT